MEFLQNKYSNPTEALKNVDASFNKLQGKFISLGTEYANKISGSLGNEVFYLFRDNIMRRLSAALFHYDILAKLNISGFPALYDLRKSPPDGFYVSLHQSYVFDSIIFHLVSGFDYFASFVKYLSYGHKDDKREIWSKLIKKIHAKSKLNGSVLGNELKAIDNEFVQKLADYRARLIHNESDFPRFSQTTKLSVGETIITVTPPKAFHKKFNHFLPAIDDCSINEVSLWLLESTLDGLYKLLKATSIYLDENRITLPEDEFIRIDTPRK